MQDFINEFISEMASKGIIPDRASDIIPDDKIRRFKVQGDKNKNAVYQLKIESNFAVGWFLWFKEGITYRWHNHKKGSLDEKEYNNLRVKIHREKKQQEDEIRNKNQAAIKRAKKTWAKLKTSGSTPYLKRKQCDLHNARIYNDNLYIPIFDGQGLVNLQKIMPDGTKRFIPGGKKKGCYSVIKDKDDDISKLYITEGWATAASIRQSLKAVVVIAFDAGNLKSVAESLKIKYPKAEFIICADNDQWTKKANGEPWNPGIEKAQEAAKLIDAKIIWPEFPNNIPEKLTDFNDLYCKYGKEIVKSKVGDAASLIPPNTDNEVSSFQSVPESFEDWKDKLIFTGEKNAKLKPNSIFNGILFLKNFDKLKSLFVYDAFSHKIILSRCPPWLRESNFAVKPLDDITITQLTAELEIHQLFLTTGNVEKIVETVAADNIIHPARDYFNSLEWDGLERLDKWLKIYMGCNQEPEEYLSFVGKKWLTAAVKRVFEPGCAFHHILVLEGEQGKGKSTVLRELATFGKETPVCYCTDNISLADISNKDTIMKMQGSIICELAELQGFSRKDDEEIKRWITMQYDDCRLPYSKSVKRFDRQFVLAATTNDSQYLKDTTGNRRYWPIKVGKMDLKAIKNDREQLWAEAVYWYRQNLYIGPTKEEMELARNQQDLRMYQDEWSVPIMEWLEGQGRVKIYDILKSALHMHIRDINRQSERRVANILKIAGYESSVTWNPVTKKSERYWQKEEEVEEEELVL